MKRKSPAAARNRDPIAAVLADELPATGLILEVASGTGEHALHFARAFPELRWQPSDPDPEARESIDAWRLAVGPANMLPPLGLDASNQTWPTTGADAVVCINMAHISPVSATEGLVAAAEGLLPSGGPLVLYGPWLEDDVATAPSNLAFDADLKARNPDWGLRHREWLDDVAAAHGFERTRRVQMPANNLVLVYRKRA